MLYQYDDLLKEIIHEGEHKKDRTGVGCRSLFGPQLWFDLRDGFPAVTGKKLQWASVVKELLWFIRGETNTSTLGCGIWDEWADEAGNCGPIYGKQWRRWTAFAKERDRQDPDRFVTRKVAVDQLSSVIHTIRNDPGCRRLIVNAWNVSDLESMALPPCHLMYQFAVGHEEDKPKYLDLKMYQRSADSFLGVPFNIASYALLLHAAAQLTDLEPRRFIHTFGDVHIYDNHFDQVCEYLSRPERHFKSPTLRMPEFTELQELEECKHSDFVLDNYEHGPSIRAPVAV